MELIGVSSVDYISTSPFAYAPAVMVDRFSGDGFLYEVVSATNQLVNFQPLSDEDFTNFTSYELNLHC